MRCLPCLCRQSQMQFIDKACVPQTGRGCNRRRRRRRRQRQRRRRRRNGRKLAVAVDNFMRPLSRHAVMLLCRYVRYLHTCTHSHPHRNTFIRCVCVWQTAAATNATKHLPICLRQNFGNILLTNEKSKRERDGESERGIEVARQWRKVGRRLKRRR